MSKSLSIIPHEVQKRLIRPRHAREGKLDTELFITKVGGDFVGYHTKVESMVAGEAWLRVTTDGFALDPVFPDHAVVGLELAVPADATYGVHGFKVRFIAEDDSADVTEVAISVDVQRRLEVWLQQHVWHVLGFAIAATLLLILVITV